MLINMKLINLFSFIRWICFYTIVVGCHVAGTLMSSAVAQQTEIPQTISPLQVDADINGVNLATGMLLPEAPTLSVPGAPRLKFNLVQNAAPYSRGQVIPFSDASDASASWTVHTADGVSEAFQCEFDIDEGKICFSATKSGSQLNFAGTRYRPSGSGEEYKYDKPHTFTVVSPGDINRVSYRQYYASQIEYPDGEIISYTYHETKLTPSAPYPHYRPTRISSNLGFYVDVSYPHDDLTNFQWPWGKPNQATVYNASDPNTPLARLTYNTNGTVTDLAGRVFGGYDAGYLGQEIEGTQYSQTLPTESSPMLVVSPKAGLPTNAEMVGSVTRDGVQWSYDYANPAYIAGVDGFLGYRYDRIDVAGPNGYSRSYEISFAGNRYTGLRHVVTRETDELGRAWNYEYDINVRLNKIINPEGGSVTVDYDNAGNIEKRTAKAKPGSGLADIINQAFYDLSPYTSVTGFLDCRQTALCWRPTWVRDALNRQTDFIYNTRGQITEITEPANQHGVRRKVINTYQDVDTGAGLVSRKTVMTTCNSATCNTNDDTRVEYQYWGNTFLPSLERRIDPDTSEVRDTAYAYDLAGRVISIDGPLAGTDDAIYFRYDSLGRRTWEIRERGSNGLRIATRTTYRDADDKPILVETGTLTSHTDTNLIVFQETAASYDSRRNPSQEMRASGGVTHTVVDRSYLDRGLPECVTQRMNPAVFSSLPSNACSLSTEGPDGRDRVQKNIYDVAGQLAQVRKGVGSSVEIAYNTYSYTNNGQQQYVIDANGNRAQFVYDGHDRLSRWIFPSLTGATSFNNATQATALMTAGAVNSSDYEQYGYDAVGNRTSLRKRDGSTLTYAYDNLDRMTLKTVPSRTGLMAAQTRDVYYDYDLNSLMTKARFDRLSGEGITNAYNGFGELTSSANDMGGTSRTLGYQWSLSGDRTRVTHPDGEYFVYDYDALGRLEAVKENGAATLSFVYNNRGLRQTLTRNAQHATTYAYDGLSRLQSIAGDLAGVGRDFSIAFDRNPASQIKTLSRTNDAYRWSYGEVRNDDYVVNGLNQYTTAGAASFAYDLNGNLASDGSTAYVYDIENRLVSASGATNASLVYDPMGRLFETSGGSAGVTQFLYDGDALVAEFNGAGALLRRYVHGAGVDEPLLWYEGAGVSAAVRRDLVADERGSIIAYADAAGVGLGINAYDAYGIPDALNAGRFQYTGQIWLPELAMYYYKARVYSPTIGRFLQTDPIGYEDQINLYAYVRNDPVNMFDPKGEAGQLVAGAATGCAITGPACPAGAVAGVVVAAVGTVAVVGVAVLVNEVFNNEEDTPPPDGLVGEDRKKTKGRVNSGPLAPTNGGNGDAEEDFDVLTGGKSSAPPEGSTLPEGSRVGENGITIRPGAEGEGPRIDIPASGDKPRETLHYPSRVVKE